MINTVFLKQHAPRWLVLLIDISIVSFSVVFAYIIKTNFKLSNFDFEKSIYVLLLILSIRIISFLISKTYSGIVRYTSTKDALRIFTVIFSGSVIIFLSNILYNILKSDELIPLSIIVIEFLTTVFIMTMSRFVVKTLYFEYDGGNKSKKKVVIYGATQLGITTKRTLEKDESSNYIVSAFFDKSTKAVGKKINGIKIYKPDDINEVFEKYNISNLIFADPEISKAEKQEIIDICLNSNIKILSIPKLDDWINGELSFKQIKKVKIEDLLERDPIELDKNQIRREIVNKVVLVTGAAGSIGSEIVRQLTKFNPKKIIAFDQAESPLYDLELELREKLNFYNFEIVIGSVTNEVRLKKLFDVFKPTVVYHAAAYKHVPMMENNPSEAIRTNVLGTKLLADMSVKFDVTKFIMISTDKAVNPTNVMGASKRIAEIYTQSLNNNFKTRFITTRFGNVLGSNGSVIPRFRRQIENGGPVTVTHPEVTRFFMTIPEACQLVLEASAFGDGGEIFIFDMGKSVKILDLAKKMIKLSGLTIGKDIQIQYSGLRPGEKLYEELLNDKENTLSTHHPQIMKAKTRKYKFEEVSKNINQLIYILKDHDNIEIVRLMKGIVPEFLSKNSSYEELDIENMIVIEKQNKKITENNEENILINNNKNSIKEPNGRRISLLH